MESPIALVITRSESQSSRQGEAANFTGSVRVEKVTDDQYNAPPRPRPAAAAR